MDNMTFRVAIKRVDGSLGVMHFNSLHGEHMATVQQRIQGAVDYIRCNEFKKLVITKYDHMHPCVKKTFMPCEDYLDFLCEPLTDE